MDVSIVIVSYNTCSLLDECIASIKRETTVSHEIIVVDNASSDDTRKMLKKKYPDVTLIENSENVGFARANNQGFAVAIGRYFFMLNPDTVVLDGAIDDLVAFMNKNHTVGICGPRNTDRDGKLQFNCDHFPSVWNTFCFYSGLSLIFPKSSIFNRCWMKYWDYSRVRNVDRIVGCSLLIRRSLYNELHGLDDYYFMYFEETDFCYRAYKRGIATYYIPDASIIHYGGESAKTNLTEIVINKTVWSYFYHSQYYFFKKNYGYASMLSIRLLDFLYGFYLVLRNYLRSKNRAENTLGRVLMRCAAGNCEYNQAGK